MCRARLRRPLRPSLARSQLHRRKPRPGRNLVQKFVQNRLLAPRRLLKNGQPPVRRTHLRPRQDRRRQPVSRLRLRKSPTKKKSHASSLGIGRELFN